MGGAVDGGSVISAGGRAVGSAGAPSGGFGPTSVGGYAGWAFVDNAGGYAGSAYVAPAGYAGSAYVDNAGGYAGSAYVAPAGYAGSAFAGNGGAGQTLPSCVYPPVDFTPSDWIDPPAQTPQEMFDSAVSGIVGSWHGVVTTPWVPPYEVVAEFDADGRYSASCVFNSDQCCVAFYYGTDTDTPLKTYSIDDATLSGDVTGMITIAFDYGDNDFGTPAWQGELSHVDIDGDGNRARFDFNTSDGYGPVHFELQRDTPSN
jgi:hypothetical protein